jgi:APA family basic amino acid/polyamine antiporter
MIGALVLGELPMSVLSRMLRHKSIEQLQAEAGKRGDFRRVLGLWQLTAIGIGGIIGVGIFVLAGQQAAANAGPGVALSFIIAGFGSACAALCYAEFAGLIPVTGSAYTYGYAVLGEFVAWIIGWDLLLEYALVVAVVAIGWSGYVQVLLGSAGIHLPEWAQQSMSAQTMEYYLQQLFGVHGAQAIAGPSDGHRFNVIAAGISLLVAALLTIRTEWGARFNTLVVTIKVIGVLLVVGVGVFYVHAANWHPFIPARVVDAQGVGHFGWAGVLTGASVVFFAVFGYDTLTTAAEEAKHPQRDLPRAVLLSLAVAMVLYIAVSLVLTGITHYSNLGGDASVSQAFESIGLHWLSVTIAVAAVIGVTVGRAGVVRAYPSAFRHAGAAYGDSWRVHCAGGGPAADRRSGGIGEHRHAQRLHHHLQRGAGAARTQAAGAAQFPRAGAGAGGAAGRAVFAVVDLRRAVVGYGRLASHRRLAVDHLRAFHHLDGAGVCDLFRLRHAA